MTASQPCIDPLATFDALREAYLRYYDTPFGLADQRLEKERRALLDRPGGAYTEPLLELRPEYVTVDRTLAESVNATGAPGELAEFATCGLFSPGTELYQHQEQALHAGIRGNMIITAGTGSGKTESFLLPMLAGLLAESRSWGGAPAPTNAWWRNAASPFIPQRQGENGRPKAVRALVLYPMNALVDDQLIRLRRALDSSAARAWLDHNRRGHRLFFGRYTGATPVPGVPGAGDAESELRAIMRQTEARSKRALSPDKEDARYFVPRLDGAEMRSRWDMLDAPPDILITNFVMLNVMLLRDRDRRFFDSTRRWLAEHPQERFTLVVDELHLYRGTAGTEVAYLIRSLKRRLGISQQPHRLRVLGASASLDPDRDRDYLEEFFGVDADSFEFIAGATHSPRRASPDISDVADTLAQAADKAPDPATATRILADTGAAEALTAALHRRDDPTTPETVSTSEAARRLFPHAHAEQRKNALRGLVAMLAASGVTETRGLPRIRAHLFFRNIAGMWACSNPRCTEIPGGVPQDNRPVGRLFSEPRPRCGCGARVLELLYCQGCGEVMLGGFAPRDAFTRRRFDAPLLADIPELEKLPDHAPQDRTAAHYVVYWPSEQDQQADDDATWTAAYGAVTYEYRRSRLDPARGQLANKEAGSTGWSFHVTVARNGDGTPRVDPNRLSPFPTRCPACGTDWEVRTDRNGRQLHVTDPLRQRSPVRTMRTGFEKASQVLTTELATQLNEADRKLIVFADSRQDAAKLAAGIGLRHYQDLVRLLLHEALLNHGVSSSNLALARRHAEGERVPETQRAYEELRAEHGRQFTELYMAWLDGDEARARSIETDLTAPPSLKVLMLAVQQQLLKMGVNPAGTAPSAQRYSETDWHELYDWRSPSPQPRAGLTPAEREALGLAETDLLESVVEAVVSSAGRDFESLGLGWLAVRGDGESHRIEPSSPTAIARASLRVLAELRRFKGQREGRDRPPKRLKAFWSSAAKALGLPVAEMEERAEQGWGDAVQEFLIDHERVAIRKPARNAWRCPTCRRQHLTYGVGVCTRCLAGLQEHDAPLSEPTNDYYAWKATEGRGRFRLASAELTGQTGRKEAQQRQARFQGIFVDGEEARVHGLELLSVTTTMEAGVDIGALSAIVMANMPPTRFNYQQRVGRAGRRRSPTAIALTICRGRSHDEHYFQHPESITNDPTPPPYLALGRREILHRALASELLRAAFDALAEQLKGSPEWTYTPASASVHGQFGYASEWPIAAPLVDDWLSRNRDIVDATVTAFASHTSILLTPEEIDTWLQELLATIHRVAAEPTGDLELSQRLATAGVLPMFGFPTDVRLLHLSPPQRRFPWPPEDAIDRDLAIALTQFAPGSEVVRDGQVYPVVGIAAFQPTQPRPTPVEPLVNARTIGMCHTCNHVAESNSTRGTTPGACPACGHTGYRTIDLREPLGFRAGQPRDFDGTFNWSPRRVAARVTSNMPDLTRSATGMALVHSGRGRRYVINDNNGRLFSFRRASERSWRGYVADQSDILDPAARGTGDAFCAAIGSVQPTDLLFFGPELTIMPDLGLRLSLSRSPASCAADLSGGRRSAWYSLAFLMRSAAAIYLDVQPFELAAGIHSAPHPEGHALYAFLADTLENGAGFSSHLGAPDVLPSFLDTLRGYIADLESPDHSSQCMTSCYHCLRDYSNMAYHPLLDWRLARDLMRLLLDRQAPCSTEREEAAIQAWAAAYDSTAVEGTTACIVGEDARVGLVAKHPLESFDAAVTSPRLLQAITVLGKHGVGAPQVVIADTHTMELSPLQVMEALGTRATRRRRAEG